MKQKASIIWEIWFKIKKDAHTMLKINIVRAFFMMMKKVSKKVSEGMFFGTFGGCLYYGIEMLFRGFSHWSMFCVGGLVFYFCVFQGVQMQWKEALWIQVLRAMLFTVSLEFMAGIIFNKWLHREIWDYSDQPLQLWGQICVPFTILFSGLLVIAIFLGGYLSNLLYKEEKPDFFVL